MRLTDYHGYFYLTVFFTGIVVCEKEHCDAMDVRCNPDQIQDKLRTKLVVAAIDFGTTYSGWAYQNKADYFRDKLANIQTSKWFHNDILSKKTPTTVLIQPNGDTLEAFGYEAETRYLELASEEEHHQYYYFKRFKMMLYDIKDLDKKTKLVDDKGLELPALTVFSLAIRFLKENLMTNLKINDAGFKVDDVFWVLTVPAIWNDMAKTFMRAAAVVAGIETEDLEIALEPEAASLYCRLDQRQRQEDSEGNAFLENFQPGRRYALLDAGGGTIDITVHELLEGYGLKELYKATGGPWGGIEVDKAFEHMLSTLIGGEEVYKTFKRECADDHLLMMWRFEITKRSINPTGETKTVIILPMCYRTLLEGTGEHLKQRIAGSVYKDDIKVRLEKIILSAGLSRSFFEEVVKRVVAHVTELLDKRELDGVDTLLMVGGFSESKMLRHALKASLDINFLFPDDGELAIVKGAVLFGYQSPHKHERIARYTYGVKTARRFLRGVHDAAKCRIFLLNEFNMCDNLFRKFVEEGTLLRYGEVHGEHEFTPVTETSRGVDVFVYACTDRFPEYVTDEECEMVSTVRLKLLNTKVRLEERIITIAFSFSGTEITVTAREKLSGNKVQTTVVFL